MTFEERLVNYLKSVRATADTGLFYSNSDYDQDRYEQLQAMTDEMLALYAGEEISVVRNFFRKLDDYKTPNVDVRGLVINEKGEILMVQERVDSKWTIPGGWADIGLTPAENVMKEVKEETGLDVKISRLLAVWDKKMHPHPPQPHYVYKMCFLCEHTGGTLQKAFDTLDARWFDPAHLPELSEDRLLAPQIHAALRIAQNQEATAFD
ncbi:MAG: NUDIX hydrolase [Bacteroidota bacterium]